MRVVVIVKIEKERLSDLLMELECEVGTVHEYRFIGKGMTSIVLREPHGKSAKEVAEKFGAEVRNYWPL